MTLYELLKNRSRVIYFIIPKLKLDESDPALLVRHPIHPPPKYFPSPSHIPYHLLHVNIFVPELIHPRQELHSTLPHIPRMVDHLILHLHRGILDPDGVVSIIYLKLPLPNRACTVQFLLGLLPPSILDPDAGILLLAPDLVLESLAHSEAKISKLGSVIYLLLGRTDFPLLTLTRLAEELLCGDLDRGWGFVLNASRPRQLVIGVLVAIVVLRHYSLETKRVEKFTLSLGEEILRRRERMRGVISD
ncbi:crooked neck-like protein 1 [Pyrus ussuriensis x Pyrus communis]|uniref:Crooked neck-like protein 1 n=1 Tax=Pyrus ussuriensis x Pyrus communis TaxID=2448454 RepID=A0A5N5HJ29_9ROSA|nr:crooked neck-like protein 1 [Pyrus ussuriensis x Pyrus communis]